MNIVVLGGAESGFGAAYLAKKKGLEVFVSDKGNIKDKYKSLMAENGIDYEENNHDETRILSADWVIKSPGISKHSEIIQKIHSKGIRISSEIEFASEFTHTKIIGITGSNGKTTTSSLIFHILKNTGFNVGLGGNIGVSFAKQIADDDFDYFVLEVSSFQLDDIQNFSPYIALILNLSPDHLDQYGYDFSQYASAKFRITENQQPHQFFIYNYEDKMIHQQLEKKHIKAQKLAFSINQKIREGAYLDNDTVLVALEDKDLFSIKVNELPLAGNHNIANIMAASIVGKILNISNENLQNALMTFRAVEHRLELFAEIEGVKYINDSKATNVNATYHALQSMSSPTVWLAGGVDKGNDYTEIEDLVLQKVKAIICLGKDNEKIIGFFREKKELIYSTSTMEECVKIAKSVAQNGDTVLLSPCCASFDLFDNYEDRGEKFKKEVLK